MRGLGLEQAEVEPERPKGAEVTERSDVYPRAERSEAAGETPALGSIWAYQGAQASEKPGRQSGAGGSRTRVRE